MVPFCGFGADALTAVAVVEVEVRAPPTGR